MNEELRKKILGSGLIEKQTAKMLETWGYLQPGEVDQVKEDALAHSTESDLLLLAEGIAELVEKDRVIHETNLDLSRLRWPVRAELLEPTPNEEPINRRIACVTGLIDSMGRYYFRVQDVHREWFVPGRFFQRNVPETNGMMRSLKDVILEVSDLYMGDQIAAYQVSVNSRPWHEDTTDTDR